jgi:hypothetical protein
MTQHKILLIIISNIMFSSATYASAYTSQATTTTAQLLDTGEAFIMHFTI